MGTGSGCSPDAAANANFAYTCSRFSELVGVQQRTAKDCSNALLLITMLAAATCICLSCAVCCRI